MGDGVQKKVWVHRKGATRAFPAGHPDVSEDYRSEGQPVLIPGSMGTSSWVLVGTQKAMELTFGSTAHGAGRMMSRAAAKRQFWGGDIKTSLGKTRHLSPSSQRIRTRRRSGPCLQERGHGCGSQPPTRYSYQSSPVNAVGSRKRLNPTLIS